FTGSFTPTADLAFRPHAARATLDQVYADLADWIPDAWRKLLYGAESEWPTALRCEGRIVCARFRVGSLPIRPTCSQPRSSPVESGSRPRVSTRCRRAGRRRRCR